VWPFGAHRRICYVSLAGDEQYLSLCSVVVLTNHAIWAWGGPNCRARRLIDRACLHRNAGRWRSEGLCNRAAQQKVDTTALCQLSYLLAACWNIDGIRHALRRFILYKTGTKGLTWRQWWRAARQVIQVELLSCALSLIVSCRWWWANEWPKHVAEK